MLEQIARQRKSRGEKFSTAGSAVFGEFWRSGKNLIGFGDKVFEGSKFRFHALTIRPKLGISKRSLFFLPADFRHYRNCSRIDADWPIVCSAEQTT